MIDPKKDLQTRSIGPTPTAPRRVIVTAADGAWLNVVITGLAGTLLATTVLQPSIPGHPRFGIPDVTKKKQTARHSFPKETPKRKKLLSDSLERLSAALAGDGMGAPTSLTLRDYKNPPFL